MPPRSTIRSRDSAPSSSSSSRRSSTRSTTRSTTTSASATRSYIAAMIEMHRRLLVLGRGRAAGLALQARLGRSAPPACSAGEDPREHGDRPQRHARPVGLDERSRDPLLDLGLGHRLDRPRRGSTPTTTSTTRSRTSSARTRTSATRSCGSTRTRSGTRSTSRSPVYNVLLMLLLRVGRRPARPRLRRDQVTGEKPMRQVKDELQGDRQKGRNQVVKDYVVFPPLSGRELARRRLLGQLHGEHGPQRLGERDHLLRPLPGPDLHVHPGGDRERDARRLVRAAADSARRTSRAGRSST